MPKPRSENSQRAKTRRAATVGENYLAAKERPSCARCIHSEIKPYYTGRNFGKVYYCGKNKHFSSAYGCCDGFTINPLFEKKS